MVQKILALFLTATILLSASIACLAEENKIWQAGDEGEEVRQIQQYLHDLNYLEEEPTGVYDEETSNAVKLFQSEHYLLITGMVDSVTMELLKTEKNPYVKISLDDYYNTAIEDGVEFYAMESESAVAVTGFTASKNARMAGGSIMSLNNTSMQDFNMDEYNHITSNGFQSVSSSPLSTFAADVDTSSYAQFRRRVLAGEDVPADSIRIEELLNYFKYDYKQPENDEPFGVTVEIAQCPWNDKTQLMQIGIQAKEVEMDDQKGHNLVFLIDTSGSMYGSDRLDLVKRAFLLLLDELKPEDTISIVAYASMDRVVLEGVPASEKTRIMEAINSLQAEGYTNGSAGIKKAYEIAEKYYVEDGVNRILLATDGDLNMGVTSEGDLVNLVMEEKKKGVNLTCLGFGMGNYKDNKMEALADYGDGNCLYIDTIYEARKALIEEAGGTFITVAKDVKIQVDFNPACIKGYRLIGYEDRLLAAEDFADDSKDGGELGSGHRMTALYEIVPATSDFEFGEVGSRYQENQPNADEQAEWLTVSIRAKEPNGDTSKLYEYPVNKENVVEELSNNMKFASAVAEVGMLLRDNEWKGTATYDTALDLLRSCETVTGDVYKEEFLYLVNCLNR